MSTASVVASPTGPVDGADDVAVDSVVVVLGSSVVVDSLVVAVVPAGDRVVVVTTGDGVGGGVGATGPLMNTPLDSNCSVATSIAKNEVPPDAGTMLTFS